MSIFKKFVLVSVSLFSVGAQAELVNIAPIHITTDMKNWTSQFDRSRANYSECAAFDELPNTILCYSTLNRMNLMFGRSSLYSEGGFGVNSGTVVPKTSPAMRRLMTAVGGHDIKSKELLEFYAKQNELCKTNNDYCLSAEEADLYQRLVLPMAQKAKSFVVISFSTSYSYQDVVTHEVLHAQYFLQPAYEQIVDDFWNTVVSAQDKAVVRRNLSMYDTTNEYVMRNEFQAYILMVGAESSQLSSLVSKFRQNLFQRLVAANVTPLQVH